MAAFGIKAIQPQDNEHIFGFASARATADDSLLEVWNGPTNSDLKFTIDKAGQLQGANGSAARPTYSFEAQKTSGRYMSGAGTFLDVIAGTAVGTWTAGKLTLVELQVDNLNINGNTLSSTAGTDLLITPLSGQQIVLDGTIVIDAGVVTGVTSITSDAFVGPITGTASLATLATTVTITDNESTDESNLIPFVAGAATGTGAQSLEMDGDLSYNPSTGKVTATGFIGTLTGTASVATVATTVTITDNESTSETNAVIFTAGGAKTGGNLGLESDGTFHYNPSSGTVTATVFVGALTGALTGNASTATALQTARTIGGTSFDGTANIAVALSATATALETAREIGGTSFDGTANIAVALATLASTVTVAASGGDTTSHIAMFNDASGSLAALTDPGLTYNATSNVLTVVGGFAGDITGDVTGNADTATAATKATLADEGSDTSCYPTFSLTATGDQPLKTDSSALTYNAGTGVLASTFSGALTGNVTGNASGSSGSCTGNSATSTLASTVTVVESTNATSFIAMFDANAATTPQAIKSDTGLTYNASNSTLAATTFSGAFSGNATTATAAATVVVVDSTDASSSIAMFDSATGSLAAKTDAGLTYNASTGMLTATGLTGPLTGLASTSTLASTVVVVASSGDTSSHIAMFDSASGSLAVKTDPGLTYDADTNILTAAGFAGPLVGNVTGTADVATTVTVTDNENDNESNCLTFVAGADQDGGNVGLESDGTLTYNPSTGKVTATGFIGTLAGAVTGDVTGNCSGTALTVTQAAQTAITSVGTLTALTVDNLGINGNTITANSGALNLTPASGSAIVLDGTINVDAGVVTGATSITSTAFVGALTGNVTGNTSGTAATVTGAAQTAITSVGTLTSVGVTGVSTLGNRIDHYTGGTGGTLAAQYGSGSDVGLNTSPGTTDFNIKAVGEFAVSAGASATTCFLIEGTAASVTGTLAVSASSYVGDTANANAGLGLTINQGTNSDQIMAFKQSNVNHGATDTLLGEDIEVDDFYTAAMITANAGGLWEQVISESGSVGYRMDVWNGGAPQTTDTSGSSAVMNWYGGLHNGSNGEVDFAANSNLCAWGEITAAGARNTMMILKADDGELHLQNTTLVAIDTEDDVALVRAMQFEASGGEGMRPKPWNTEDYGVPAFSHEKLMEVGVLGEKDADGKCLFRIQPRFAMNEGAIWQNHVRHQELANCLRSLVEANPHLEGRDTALALLEAN